MKLCDQCADWCSANKQDHPCPRRLAVVRSRTATPSDRLTYADAFQALAAACNAMAATLATLKPVTARWLEGATTAGLIVDEATLKSTDEAKSRE